MFVQMHTYIRNRVEYKRRDNAASMEYMHASFVLNKRTTRKNKNKRRKQKLTSEHRK
jgi:hypothetical protein